MRHRLRWTLVVAVMLLGAPSHGTCDEDETGASVAGHVVSADGGGVAGVTVSVRRGGWRIGHSKTDKAGHFLVRITVAGIGPVDLFVAGRVEVPTPLVWKGELLAVSVGASELRIAAASTPADRCLRVQVSCPKGPVEGIEVRLDPAPVGAEWRGDTDEEGLVQFDGLTADPVAVEVVHLRPWAPARSERGEPGGGVLKMVLEPMKMVDGTVLGVDGRPAVGIGVMAKAHPGSTALPLGDLTGTKGKFHVSVPASWSTATIRAGLQSPTDPSCGLASVLVTWKVGQEPKPLRIRLPAPHDKGEAVANAGRTGDRAAIYELILRTNYLTSETECVVLPDPLDRRMLPRMGWEVDAYSQFGLGLRAFRGRIHESTWLAFKKAVRSRPPTPRDLEIGVPAHVVPRGWWYFLRRDQDREFWGTFYRKFPKSSGVIDLSPIGISDDGKQAFVHISRFVRPLNANGKAYLLTKTEEGWEITAETMTWVS